MHARRLLPPGVPSARVVLVHGMVLAGRSMARFAQALAERGLEVHLPDLPGFGRSEKPGRALDVPGLSRSLAAWVGSRVPERPVMVGNSFGTQVAAAAVAGGCNVSKLVLVSPTIDARFRAGWVSLLPPGRPAGGVRHGMIARFQDRLVDLLVADDGLPGGLSLRHLLVSEYLAAGPSRALSTYRHALRDDLLASLGGTDSPLVVVRGALDRFVSPAWARAVASAGRPGKLVELDGVDHDGQFKQPARLAGAVVDAVGSGQSQ